MREVLCLEDKDIDLFSGIMQAGSCVSDTVSSRWLGSCAGPSTKTGAADLLEAFCRFSDLDLSYAHEARKRTDQFVRDAGSSSLSAPGAEGAGAHELALCAAADAFFRAHVVHVQGQRKVPTGKETAAQDKDM